MKHLSLMIKPASSLCNMRCRYCFYADVSTARDIKSYGTMTLETAQALIQRVFEELESGDSVTFAFQGGEPTLAGLSFFRAFVAEVQAQTKNVTVSWALQTNGLVLDETWCHFLREHRFLVGLSLDGDAALHNANRLNSANKGSFLQVLKAKKNLEATGVDYNVLCVLTNETARYPERIWKFFRQEQIRYIQLIPCLDHLDAKAKHAWALTPRRFFGFYSRLFPLWRKAALQGDYVSIKLFDDIVNLLLRRQVTACGIHGACQVQTVVEADGSVYPCDFYVLDENRLGNLTQEHWSAMRESPVAAAFLTQRQELPPTCTRCQYLNICGGGCKRMEKSMYVDDHGYCGYQAFLEQHLEELLRVGELLLRS